MTSLWQAFFETWKDYKGRALVYMVPAHYSIPGDLDGRIDNKRVRNLGDTLDFSGNNIQYLPPVMHVLQLLKMDKKNSLGHPEHFYDSMHMSRAATKEVTLWYWKYIEEQLGMDGPTVTRAKPGNPGPEGYEVTTRPSPLPEELRGPRLRMVLWDYNASSQQYANNHAKWRTFWTSLVEWCNATPPNKRKAAEAMLDQVRGDKPDKSWYKNSRLQVVPKSKKMLTRLDESTLPEMDEREFAGDIGDLPGTPWSVLQHAPPAPPMPPRVPRTTAQGTIDPNGGIGPCVPRAAKPLPSPTPQMPMVKTPDARSTIAGAQATETVPAMTARPGWGLPLTTAYPRGGGGSRVSLSPENDYDADGVPLATGQGLPRG
jgi:hypothetical protein